MADSCPACGFVNEDEARTCLRCGVTLREPLPESLVTESAVPPNGRSELPAPVPVSAPESAPSESAAPAEMEQPTPQSLPHDLAITALSSGVSAFVGGTVGWALSRLTGWRARRPADEKPKVILPPGVDPPKK